MEAPAMELAQANCLERAAACPPWPQTRGARHPAAEH
eukprot:CAMPEP_0175661926 /NCGR_PEP_ID=MMETSP0097-20121207/15206_1 /TAXON_ID=311494 /ORGANISM="Alexandrium monilatum, Strain CCMP3105" /LENGTH=36 /DNA_ID= /DNA_START= /DNA_END= /DNA_ORIENTATION=